MIDLKAIAVFCGSSEGNDTEIISQAEILGHTLAKEEITLVYGAAKIGIMGKVAQGVLDNHGKVIGVIPEFLKLKENGMSIMMGPQIKNPMEAARAVERYLLHDMLI